MTKIRKERMLHTWLNCENMDGLQDFPWIPKTKTTIVTFCLSALVACQAFTECLSGILISTQYKDYFTINTSTPVHLPNGYTS